MKVIWIVLISLILVWMINDLVEKGVLFPFLFFPFKINNEKTFPELPVSETWRTDSVSKIIHQTAPSDVKRWHEDWARCQATWKAKFPDYEYKMWTDEDLDEFIRTKYPWFYPTFIGYDVNIKRIDSARYFILYEYGGIYADMDYECMENFEDELPLGKASIAESKLKKYWFAPEKYQNALMASPPKHPFWNFVFKILEKNKNVDSVLFATGPNVIREAAETCPDEAFHGLSYAEYTEGARWAQHHGTTTWVTNGFARSMGMFFYSLA